MLHDPDQNTLPSKDLDTYKETLKSALSARSISRDDFRDVFRFAVENVYGSHKISAEKLGIGMATCRRWESEGAPHAINRYVAVRIIAKDVGLKIPKAFS